MVGPDTQERFCVRQRNTLDRRWRDELKGHLECL